MWKAASSYVQPATTTISRNWTLKSDDDVLLGPIPPAEFLWGLNQAEGMSPNFSTSADTGTGMVRLTPTEMALLRDEVGINSIRMFVHPTLLGIPQLTWCALGLC